MYLAANGCRQGFDWQGDWVGQRNIATVPGAAPEIVNSIQRVTLTVKSNWDYELHASGVPSSGVFHAAGNEATLEQIKLLDRPVENAPAIKLKANQDGTITLSSPDSLDSGPILLHRESQPTGSNVRKR